ncbi:unnamed protein product [Nezara viridula]|uniref:Uncharacterized protein n=1 Tax=Nezara viridula TaxID=85310 RepID=A0A9P0HNH5_NEZVI|nr:unnamed protein product [Nezara viridula]
MTKYKKKKKKGIYEGFCIQANGGNKFTF